MMPAEHAICSRPGREDGIYPRAHQALQEQHGGREAGGLAHLLPGYRTVVNADHRLEVESAWKLPDGRISDKPGLAAWQQVEAMERGELDLWWVAATNPLVSMPDLDRVKAAIAN